MEQQCVQAFPGRGTSVGRCCEVLLSGGATRMEQISEV